jgi:hypothetical protein
MGFFYSKTGKFIRGAISIFLSLIMLGMLAVSALLMEGGRLQAARQEIDEATIHSALSMLANFDEALQDRFGLLALDEREANAAAYGEYLRFNSGADASGTYAGNRISTTYSVASTSYDAMYDLANMDVLKRQILEHQKYRAPAYIANELLEIDKMLEKLIENALNAIPGLTQLLDILNLVSSLLDAIGKIYELEVTVAVLENSIKGTSFGRAIWEGLDSIFRQDSWDNLSPTYNTQYDALAGAINAKIAYMIANPEPPDPGPGPPVPAATINSLQTTLDNARNWANDMLALERLLLASVGFVGTTGVLNGNQVVNFLNFDDRNALVHFGLTNNFSTRTQLINELNNRIPGLIGSTNTFTNTNRFNYYCCRNCSNIGSKCQKLSTKRL